jgi:acyl carrier protein
MAVAYTEGDLRGITEILCRLLSKDRVSVEADGDIYQMGFTSIMVLPLLVELEESFHVVIPDAEFMEARTVRALAELIGQLRPGS